MKEEIIKELLSQGGKTFEEVIAWQTYSHTIGLWFAVAMFVIGVIGVVFVLCMKEKGRLLPEWTMIPSILGCFFIVIGIMMFILNAMELKQLKTAPRAAFVDTLGGR